MIKHNSSDSVLSIYNPIVSLDARVRNNVNEYFIRPILEKFFLPLGGLSCYEELEPDKLITDVDFKNNTLFYSFVKQYLYNEVITNITKDLYGKVIFKPKYVITFDEELSNYDFSRESYPHKEEKIKYGVLRLGNTPVLYYILVNLQDLIKYIKNISFIDKHNITPKISESEIQKRNRLINTLIVDKSERLERNIDIKKSSEIEADINRLSILKNQPLQGEKGKLRINLSWGTTDDLDLSVMTPSGEIISYNNKIIEYQGIIGELDIDKNASIDIVSNPQENINWDGYPSGIHEVVVNFYKMREKEKVNFTLLILPDGQEGRVYNDFVEHMGDRKSILLTTIINRMMFVSLSLLHHVRNKPSSNDNCLPKHCHEIY